MSIKIFVCDDFTGEPGASTFTFALGRDSYEIDLASDTALRAALEPFVAVARKAPGNGSKSAHTGGPNLSHAQRRMNQEIRQWAAEQGVDCPPRGMIPRKVREAYTAVHGGDQ
jgi:hypothetical protein